VNAAKAYGLQPGYEPVVNICAGHTSLYVLDIGVTVPTTLLISSTRRLKLFHFTPPTRRNGYWSLPAFGASNFKKGFDVDE